MLTLNSYESQAQHESVHYLLYCLQVYISKILIFQLEFKQRSKSLYFNKSYDMTQYIKWGLLNIYDIYTVYEKCALGIKCDSFPYTYY
jgi:hypothetical protein